MDYTLDATLPDKLIMTHAGTIILHNDTVHVLKLSEVDKAWGKFHTDFMHTFDAKVTHLMYCNYAKNHYDWLNGVHYATRIVHHLDPVEIRQESLRSMIDGIRESVIRSSGGEWFSGVRDIFATAIKSLKEMGL